jgi:hypothetical protein
MDFWDLAPPEPEGKDLDFLIAVTPPNLDDILQHVELLSSFRAHHKPLVEFLLTNLSGVINAIFTSEVLKAAKQAVELFCVARSALLSALLADRPMSDKLVSYVPSSDLLRLGFVSRLFQKAFASVKPEAIAFFDSSPAALSILARRAEVSSMADLLETYVLALPPEGGGRSSASSTSSPVATWPSRAPFCRRGRSFPTSSHASPR